MVVLVDDVEDDDEEEGWLVPRREYVLPGWVRGEEVESFRRGVVSSPGGKISQKTVTGRGLT